MAVEVNANVRDDEEWFDEPDDLERVQRVLSSVANELDPLRAAGLLMSRLVRAQGFCEGNKRTALVLGVWMLERNGVDPRPLLRRSDDRLLRLLLLAARGDDVAEEVVALLQERSQT